MDNNRSLPVALTPIEEQRELVRLSMKQLAGIDVSSDKVAESGWFQSQLDPSILAKAFRGELVLQDPRDEPASEFLARIRATREAEDASKKKSGKKATRKRTKK